MKRQMPKRSLDIEDLLGWTYRQQLADTVLDRGYGLHPIERQVDGIPVRRASADGVDACMKSGALGTPPAGATPSIKNDIHPDAERVHNTVKMLGDPAAMVLIRHAKYATRPDWLPDARHRHEPAWKGSRKFDDATGLPVKGSFEIITERDRSYNRISSYCPISEYDEPDYVDAKRDVYRRWHRDLMVLAGHFGQVPLTEHTVTGPGVPAEPWLPSPTASPLKGLPGSE
jgi:hypothetical protein